MRPFPFANLQVPQAPVSAHSSSKRGEAGLSLPSIHALSSLAVSDTRSAAASGTLGSRGPASSGGSLESVGAGGGIKSWSTTKGLSGLLSAPASNSTAARASAASAAAMLQRKSSCGAAALARCQWQQQQWQQGAFGEVLPQQQQQQHQSQRAAGTAAQQQQVTAKSISQLKQLVPVMQPPCVSELAAAARPFPAGLLTASLSRTAAAAGGDVQGLKLLVLEQAAGGCVTLAAAGGAVVPGDVPAAGCSGRR